VFINDAYAVCMWEYVKILSRLNKHEVARNARWSLTQNSEEQTGEGVYAAAWAVYTASQ